MFPFRLRRVALCAMLSLFAMGCGDDNPKGLLPISGAVTLDGQPLDEGTIEFQPTGSESTGTGGMIANGKYEIVAAQGLAPGTYRVIISAAVTQGDVEPIAVPGESRPVLPDRIPPEYNVKSTVVREVKAGQDNRFDFEIQSKK